MDRLLARLERRIGKLAIENLAFLLVGGMGAVFLLHMLRPEFEALIVLDLRMVAPPHWQLWRLFTYLFIPLSYSVWFMLFDLYFVWLVVSGLEAEWGPFKLNGYYLVGMAGTTVAAAITGAAVGNVFLNASLFLAWATLFPEMEIYLFMILPVKVKWLGWLTAGWLAYAVVTGGWAARAAIVAAVGNYFLFFGGHLAAVLQGRSVRVRQAARRASQPPPAKVTGGRTCAMCGAAEDQGADIRVCSCEKCGGAPRTLCLPHARNH